MDEHDGRTVSQATPKLLQGFEPLVVWDEMEGQNRRGGIERTLWGGVDIAFMQTYAGGVWLYHSLGQPKHIGRWVHAIE